MYEMKFVYTLDEMLLLYALYQRDRDIEDQQARDVAERDHS